ncbi:MAG: cyclic nucleotide-binding domain-containing protein [Rectinemataceae bacterium]
MIDSSSLQKYSLFGGVLPEQIEKIKPLFGTQFFEKGQSAMREGEPNDRIFFIMSGKVEITRQGVSIVTLGEGETFGEMELLDTMPAIATVRVLEPSETVTITNRAVYEIFKIDPKAFSLIIMNLARDLSRRLRHMDELACKEPRGGA